MVALPSSGRPNLVIAPAVKSIASASWVLPEPPWPTIAIVLNRPISSTAISVNLDEILDGYFLNLTLITRRRRPQGYPPRQPSRPPRKFAQCIHRYIRPMWDNGAHLQKTTTERIA